VVLGSRPASDTITSANIEPPSLGEYRSHSDGSSGFVLIGRQWPAAVCFGIYLILATVEYGSFGSLGPSRMSGNGSMDSIEQIWWLAWTAHALTHGESIFVASGQNYPRGQNFGVNGSMLALGTIFLPITKLFGPIVTWNVALRLAIALSATSMCLVLRRWTTWWPAAFLGGLLYGFSSYTSSPITYSYLFLIFVPLPPLFFLLLHEIVVRQRWRPGWVGLLLGVLCAIQFFISTEVLASMVVMGAVAVALFAVVRSRTLIERWRYTVTALSCSLGVAVLLLSYPLWVTFAGPEHINGPPAGPALFSFLPVDAFSSIAPNGAWIHPEQLTFTGNSFRYGGMLYLGIPLIVVLLIFAVAFRKRRAILFAGSMALCALVLSLGSSLWIDGQKTSIPLPFTLLKHLPTLDGLASPRFSLYTALFASGMFAMGIEELWKRLTRTDRGGLRSFGWGKVTGTAVCGVVAVAVIIPLVPARSHQSVPTNVPAFFESKLASSIPSGSVVLAYPYPDKTSTNSLSIFFPTHSVLLYQAVMGPSFALIGGYGWFPQPTGHFGTTAPALLKPGSVEETFDADYSGEASAPRTVSTASQTTDLRAFLRKYRVQTVLVLHVQGSTAATRYVTRAIGPPLESGGVTVWYHVGRRLARSDPR
jgi:hypothetical protein